MFTIPTRRLQKGRTAEKRRIPETENRGREQMKSKNVNYSQSFTTVIDDVNV